MASVTLISRDDGQGNWIVKVITDDEVEHVQRILPPYLRTIEEITEHTLLTDSQWLSEYGKHFISHYKTPLIPTEHKAKQPIQL
jgi:hypothetical protein